MEIEIPEPFIFGEIFELVAYIGLYDRLTELKKSSDNNLSISLYSNIEADMESELTANELNDFNFGIEKEYKISIDIIEDWIKQIVTSVPLDVDEIITNLSDEFFKLVNLCVEHNIFFRSSIYKNASNEDKKSYSDKFLTKTNRNTLIKLVNSAYNTGSFFLDWLIFKYKNNFDILIEPTLINQETSVNRNLKPDIVIKDKDSGIILLVGDLKSYYPFLTSNYAEMLKDVIDQIPIYSTTKHILNSFSLKINPMYPYKFRSRFNLLLRYFKLLRYMDWIYDRKEMQSNQAFDGLILFPSKPVLLRVKNKNEIRTIRRKLKKIIPFEIRSYPSYFGKIDRFNLQDHFPELEELLESGDAYIDKNEEEHYYFIRHRNWNEVTQTTDEINRELCKMEKFPKHEQHYKAGLVPTSNTTNFSINELRSLHLDVFTGKLYNLSKTPFNLLINSSDQGIGKNHSIAEFLSNKIDKKEKISVLFLCPRKEPIKFTISKLVENIREKGIDIEFSLDQILGENWLFTNDEYKIRIGYIHNDQIKFDYYNLRKTFKKKEIINEKGSSASKKLKSFMSSIENENNDWVNLAFVTSDTLPSFIQMTNISMKNIKKSRPYINLSTIFKNFDYLIFDELTNSNPSVRESFVDILKFRPILNNFDPNFKEKQTTIVVLDASITSFDLFIEMLVEMLDDSGPYFVPFKELLQTTDSSMDDQKTINVRGTDLNVDFYRQQINYPLNYGIVSIGSNKYVEYDFSLLFQLIDNNILKNINLERKSINEFLENGEILFYVDNKGIIEELKLFLEERDFDVGIITYEHKDDEFEHKNIIGTNSLAFGTSYKDKKIMIILPSSPGVDSYVFKQQTELYRQVTKRMRGSLIEINRLIIFSSFPIVYEGELDLEDTVNVQFLQLRNYIINYVTNRIYHQIPSFSSVINSQNWIENKTFNSLYHTVFSNISKEDNEGNEDEYLEVFMRDTFPRLKRVLNNWGITIFENFEIAFDSDRIVKRLPIPSYLTYNVNHELFARFFKLKFLTLGKMKEKSHEETPIGRIKSYLSKENSSIKEDWEFLYNLSNIAETKDITSLDKIIKIKKSVNDIINSIDALQLPISLKNEKLCRELENLFNLRFLRTSGSAFLMSLELAIVSDQVITSAGFINRRQEENIKYRNKLYATSSPLKTLFYGASGYYETPITISFRSGKIISFGFLCYYPKFKDFKEKKSYIQLLQKCLLSELFRENLVYIPNVIADLNID